MRGEADQAKIERFMVELGRRVRGKAKIYLTGGTTAVLEGWRSMTLDLDLKPVPEPPGLFEAIAVLKEEIDINVELASPDDFIPPLPGWEERSRFIAQHGKLTFYQYDLFAQALAKIERGHTRDLSDVAAMLDRSLIHREGLLRFFETIQAKLIRYPAIEPSAFGAAVKEVCKVKD